MSNEPIPQKEPCDRAGLLIQRATNMGWLTDKGKAEMQAHIRIGLDTEVEAGGPYLNNGWNRASANG